MNQVYVDTVASIPGVRARFVDELQNALSANATADAISEIAALPFVSRIEQTAYGPAIDPPSVTTGSGDNTGTEGSSNLLASVLATMDVQALHDAGYAGFGIRVAVLDSGVDMTHQALAPKALQLVWRDLVNDRSEPYDDYFHGTVTAALAVGRSNEANYRGAAYGARLTAVKVVDSQGNGDMDTFNEGIQFAVSTGANVISVSLNYKVISDDPLVCHTIDGTSSAAVWVGWAVSRGVLVVDSAGNHGSFSCGGSPIGTPADNFNAITVGATNVDGTSVADFSSRGPTFDGRLKPDVVAPGDAVQVACASVRCPQGPGYITQSGTSISAPLVAGAIASILEKSGSALSTTVKLKAGLRQTARDIDAAGPDNTSGFGLIQANQASNTPSPNMDFAWDDAFTVRTDFFHFTVSDQGYVSFRPIVVLDSYQLNTASQLSAFDIPWVEVGSSGWIRPDNSLLVVGPYISQSDPASRTMRAVYQSGNVRLTLSIKLTLQAGGTQVKFEPSLSFETSSPTTINARMHFELDVVEACCDYVEPMSGGLRLTTESRFDGANLRFRDSYAGHLVDVTYNVADGNPYEWILVHPGNRDNPDSALDAESINGANLVLEYQSRRGAGTEGSIGPTLTIDTHPDRPSWPFGSTLTVGNPQGSSLRLQWPSAVFGQSVDNYRIYVDGALFATVSKSNLASGAFPLSEDRVYTIEIEAVQSGLLSPKLYSQGTTWKLVGDANKDCVNNVSDLARIGSTFFLREGQSGFDPEADLNNDGLINITDLALSGANFGRSCPP